MSFGGQNYKPLKPSADSPQVPTVWILSRDGKEIGRFDTETAAWNYLHNVCSSSVDWALRYEGYKLEQVV